MCSVQKKLLNGKNAGKRMRAEWLRNLYSTLQLDKSWLATLIHYPPTHIPPVTYALIHLYVSSHLHTYYMYTCLSNSIKIIVYTFFSYFFFSHYSLIFLIIITVIFRACVYVYTCPFDSRAREQVHVFITRHCHTIYVYSNAMSTHAGAQI